MTVCQADRSGTYAQDGYDLVDTFPTLNHGSVYAAVQSSNSPQKIFCPVWLKGESLFRSGIYRSSIRRKRYQVALALPARAASV